MKIGAIGILDKDSANDLFKTVITLLDEATDAFSKQPKPETKTEPEEKLAQHEGMFAPQREQITPQEKR